MPSTHLVKMDLEGRTISRQPYDVTLGPYSLHFNGKKFVAIDTNVDALLLHHSYNAQYINTIDLHEPYALPSGVITYSRILWVDPSAGVFEVYSFRGHRITRRSAPGLDTIPEGLAFDDRIIWMSSLQPTARVQMWTRFAQLIKTASMSAIATQIHGIAFDGKNIWLTTFNPIRFALIDRQFNIIKVIDFSADFEIVGGLAYNGKYLYQIDIIM